MAIIYPGAAYRQLPGKSKTPLVPRVINIHTMVGGLAGVENYFRQPGNPYSHFGTGGDGEVRQWQDCAFRAASDLNGNPYCISIENEDRGPLFPGWSGSDVPRFTDKQADALVLLLSWLCHRFNIPKSAIHTSCPHESGIGYHRLGVDPYRNKSCGHKWSSAYGKVCPGDRRIAQLHNEIIPRVSAPAEPKEPEVPEEDEMPAAILYYKSGKRTEAYQVSGVYANHLKDKDAINGAKFFGATEWNTKATALAPPAGTRFLDGPFRNVANLDDIQGLPAQVVAALRESGIPSGGGGGGLTEAQIEAAVSRALGKTRLTVE